MASIKSIILGDEYSRLRGVAILIVLLASMFFPFAHVDGDNKPTYAVNFFFVCVLNIFMVIAWAVNILTVPQDWRGAFPFDWINLSPAAAISSMFVGSLLIIDVRPAKWIGVVILISLALSFHRTATLNWVLYPYLVGAWLWGAGCLAAGLMCFFSPGGAGARAVPTSSDSR